MDQDMLDAIRKQATYEACGSFVDDPQGNTDNTIDAIACGVNHAIQLMVKRGQNRALIAMFQAFTRRPGNDDEKHHALTLAEAAIAKATIEA